VTRRSAPAALRNREPIAAVLAGWLPDTGVVLEIASGTGEHAAFFAERFPALDWQPSDRDEEALESIRSWREECGLVNLRPPVRLDSAGQWPEIAADAILCINMAHISPWEATIGLLDGAGRLLAHDAPLIFYGPWIVADVVTAPSNLEFDLQLRERDPRWGIRRVEDLFAAADSRGFTLVERRAMPANNFMLLFRRFGGRR